MSHPAASAGVSAPDLLPLDDEPLDDGPLDDEPLAPLETLPLDALAGTSVRVAERPPETRFYESRECTIDYNSRIMPDTVVGFLSIVDAD